MNATRRRDNTLAAKPTPKRRQPSRLDRPNGTNNGDSNIQNNNNNNASWSSNQRETGTAAGRNNRRSRRVRKHELNQADNAAGTYPAGIPSRCYRKWPTARAVLARREATRRNTSDKEETLDERRPPRDIKGCWAADRRWRREGIPWRGGSQATKDQGRPKNSRTEPSLRPGPPLFSLPPASS